jgi:AraC-type DNA-binding domain-containing proteins
MITDWQDMEHRIRDGFRGQRLEVLPRPLVDELVQIPPFYRLIVTDAGFFPDALRHGRSRPNGAEQVIVLYCVEGTGWCQIGGVTHEVGAGQVLIIPPGTPHNYGSDPVHPWSIWWFHCEGSDIPDLISATGATAEKPVIIPNDLMRLTELCNEILSLMERDSSPINLTGASGAAWHFFTLLVRKRGSVIDRTDPIEEALSILRNHASDSIRVSELAAQVGLSTSYFSSLFRRSVGCGVVEFQRRQRMSEARTLLDSTTLSISEIAVRVGYDDPFYFSRQFSKSNGISPRDYRRSMKG